MFRSRFRLNNRLSTNMCSIYVIHQIYSWICITTGKKSFYVKTVYLLGFFCISSLLLNTWTNYYDPARNPPKVNYLLAWDIMPVLIINSTTPCYMYNCILTRDKNLYNISKVILFDAYRLKWNKIPLHRYPWQTWVLFYTEPPRKVKAKKWHDRKFNMTMSYHRKVHDLLAPYWLTYYKNGTVKQSANTTYLTQFPPRDKNDQCLQRTIEPRKGNVTKVLWYVSDFHPVREAYAKQLRDNGIVIDIYGKRGKRDPCKVHYSVTNCVKDIYSQYKFYLGFENSLCQDYITGLLKYIIMGTNPFPKT